LAPGKVAIIMFDGVHGNGRELKRFPKRVEMQWGPSLNNWGPHDGSSVPLRLAPILPNWNPFGWFRITTYVIVTYVAEYLSLGEGSKLGTSIKMNHPKTMKVNVML
jgi:hypothetical protein